MRSVERGICPIATLYTACGQKCVIMAAAQTLDSFFCQLNSNVVNNIISTKALTCHF